MYSKSTKGSKPTRRLSLSPSLTRPISAAELALMDEATTVEPAVTSKFMSSAWSWGIDPPFAAANEECDFLEVRAQAFVHRIPVFLINLFLVTIAIEAVRLASSSELDDRTNVTNRFVTAVAGCFVIYVLFLVAQRFCRVTTVRAVVEVCCTIFLPVVVLFKPLYENAVTYCDLMLFSELYFFFITVNILRPSAWGMSVLIPITSEKGLVTT